VKALTEVVEGTSSNIEIAVVERGAGPRFLTDEEVDAILEQVEAEKPAPGERRQS
jgi:20S proteasome subunit alpha 4